MLKPILALPASQFCVRGRVVRSSKKQRIDPSVGPQLLLEWDECEQLLHEQHVTASIMDAAKPDQIPWLVPPVSAGLDTNDRLINFKGGSPAVLMTTDLRTPQVPSHHQHAANCTSCGALEDCKSIVRHSSALPISSLRDGVSPCLPTTRSLLAAVAKYMTSSKAAKCRHSPDERSNCCLCHISEDDSERTAIHTLEELKAFVHKDVAEMLRPICREIATLKADLEKKTSHEQLRVQSFPRGKQQQPAPLQMISGDLSIPDDGNFMSPGSSSVLTNDSHFASAQQQQHSQRYHPSIEDREADHSRRKLPMLVEEFPVNPTGGAEPRWYTEKLKEKSGEIEALQATVYDLVGYQQKISAEFEKVKRHLCDQAAQGRSLSSPSSFPDGRPTLYLDEFESSFKAAMAAIDHFTTHFVAYSEARFHVPANKIWKPNFRNAYLAKESHWTYALKAFFCEKLFVGFENESFMTDAASLNLDPVKLRKESYAYFKRAANSVESSSSSSTSLYADGHFRIYCEQKFGSIVPDAILLQPGDCDEHAMSERLFPTLAEVNLSKSFTAAALKVWTLHKLSFSFEPTASIFRARRGVVLDSSYMESVVRLEDDERFVPKVGFMIAPGFRLRNSTLKSQIYLASKPVASQVGIHRPLQV
ncbi:unnamed protein product [Calypogeia fissa]